MSTVSIIMPVFNAQSCVARAIKSVLRQTFQNWEFIIVDDGSQDNSLSICEKYAKQDERIQVIHQANQGQFLARKTGFDLCKQDYIAFLDADDRFTDENSLQNMVLVAQKEDADVVCAKNRTIMGSKFIIVLPDKRSSHKEHKVYNHEQIMDELYVSFFGRSNLSAALWAKLFRYEILEEAMNYEQRPKVFAEDLLINALALPKAERLVIISDVVYDYARGGLTSRFMPEFINDAILMYEVKKRLLEQNSIPQNGELLVQIELRNICYSWLLMCLKKAKYSHSEMINEIKRVREMNAVNEILLVEGVYNRQNVEFTIALRDRNYDGVLAILQEEETGIFHKGKNFIGRFLKN